MLHQAHDAAEGWEIRTEYTIVIHFSHYVRQAGTMTKQCNKQASAGDILAELAVDQRQRVMNQPYCVSPDAFKFGLFLQNVKHLKQGKRLPIEYVIINDINIAIDGIELPLMVINCN